MSDQAFARGHRQGYEVGHRIGRAQVVRRLSEFVDELERNADEWEVPSWTIAELRAVLAERAPACEAP